MGKIKPRLLNDAMRLLALLHVAIAISFWFFIFFVFISIHYYKNSEKTKQNQILAGM